MNICFNWQILYNFIPTNKLNITKKIKLYIRILFVWMIDYSYVKATFVQHLSGYYIFEIINNNYYLKKYYFLKKMKFL